MKARSWIITSVANGVFLTFERVKSSGFNVDECHYTSDSAVVYTYIHFKTQVEEQAMAFFLDAMRTEINFVLFEVFGYNASTPFQTEEGLVDHIGFKMLLAHYQQKNSAFHACTDGAPGISRGLIWQYDTVPRIKELLDARSKRLKICFDEILKDLATCKQKAEMVDLLQEQLSQSEAKVEELGRYQFACLVLQYRITQLDPASRELMLEPDHLGHPIFPV